MPCGGAAVLCPGIGGDTVEPGLGATVLPGLGATVEGGLHMGFMQHWSAGSGVSTQKEGKSVYLSHLKCNKSLILCIALRNTLISANQQEVNKVIQKMKNRDKSYIENK